MLVSKPENKCSDLTRGTSTAAQSSTTANGQGALVSLTRGCPTCIDWGDGPECPTRFYRLQQCPSTPLHSTASLTLTSAFHLSFSTSSGVLKSGSE